MIHFLDELKKIQLILSLNLILNYAMAYDIITNIKKNITFEKTDSLQFHLW